MTTLEQVGEAPQAADDALQDNADQSPVQRARQQAQRALLH
jgi:hypothetical protein